MKKIRDYCLECGEQQASLDGDICLCEKCEKKFDLNKLWEDHDSGLTDALDFNEHQEIREKYRHKNI